MVKEVKELIMTLYESDKYKQFHENYPDYYLAHCFVQLDKDGNESKQWQFGFYSPEKDNLTSFTLEPGVKRGEFEEAFKDGGIIQRLHTKELVEAHHAMDIVNEIIEKEYKGELANNYILIIQTIDDVPTYNITAVTMSFSMITIKINAKTGDVLEHQKRSILDLKKDEE